MYQHLSHPVGRHSWYNPCIVYSSCIAGETGLGITSPAAVVQILLAKWSSYIFVVLLYLLVFENEV
ncbi:hypothetical protein BJX64DRAFT_270526 [Aspergillus heterothallicus]